MAMLSPRQPAQPEPDLLPSISGEGFHCSVYAYAWERAGYSRKLYMLSLLGSLVNVKAIWANLLKGRVMQVHPPGRTWGGEYIQLAFSAKGAWESQTRSLPNASAHELVLRPKIARFDHVQSRDFLILPRSDEEAPRLYYRFLDARCELPMHVLWADWLWQRALRRGEVVGLETFGPVQAYRCTFETAALQEAISEALASRALPLPSA